VARIPPLPQPKQELDLATPERCKAELTCYVKADQLGIEPATCKSQVQRPTATTTWTAAVYADYSEPSRQLANLQYISIWSFSWSQLSKI